MLQPRPQILAGERIRLEPLETAHERGLRIAATTDETGAFALSGPGGPDSIDDWIAVALEMVEAGARVAFVVVLARGRAVVGSSSYLEIAPDDGRLEIGDSWYSPESRDTFVSIETNLLLLANAFDALGATRVGFRTDAEDSSSRSSIERLGASFEGVHRRRERRPDRSLRDTAYYSVLRDEWPTVRAGLVARLARTLQGEAVP